MTAFNLVHEPWIPALSVGRPVEVSLHEALTGAHDLDGMSLADPLQSAALLRQVLLPVVLDALGVPRTAGDWATRWQSGRLDATAIADYLAKHSDRFDLFHPVRPFAQVAGLRTERNDTKPVSLLLPAVASGNNVPLFTSRTEADPPALSPAQAARAVLAVHCWDTAAIKSGAVGDPLAKAGKTTGNKTGPAGQLGLIIPMGATLAETLLLNTPILAQGLAPEDRPQWRAESPPTAQWQTRPATGLLDLLTWQSRRVRLVPQVVDGRVVVRSVVLAAGDRLDHTPPDVEPHTAWRQNRQPKASRAAQLPIRHQPGRAAWRGMASLLATQQTTQQGESSSRLLTQLGDLRFDELVPDNLRLQVLSIGVAYGNQSAVIEDVITDLIPLPITALTDGSPVKNLLLRVAEEADQLRDAANRLGDDLRRAVGADKLPWDKGLRLGDGLVHEFNSAVRRLLGGLQREPGQVDDAEDAWRTTARQLAFAAIEPALASAPPEAFIGRQISDKLAYRLSLAEAQFRRRVNHILGPATRVPATTTGA